MANRQAIRDLQSRLAERLQAAQTEGVAASWLAVQCGETGYLLPLDQAGEIFPWTRIQSVPYTQNWFLGVANLRGGLFGVVDLKAFVAGSNENVKRDAVRTESRLVALNAELDINCAVLVDRLAGLRAAKAFASVVAVPPDAPAYLGNVYTDSSGRQWQEINLQQLARFPEFLTIGI
jgi:twitching motility protein PilI